MGSGIAQVNILSIITYIIARRPQARTVNRVTVRHGCLHHAGTNALLSA